MPMFHTLALRLSNPALTNNSGAILMSVSVTPKELPNRQEQTISLAGVFAHQPQKNSANQKGGDNGQE
jgi:hypothetical protein